MHRACGRRKKKRRKKNTLVTRENSEGYLNVSCVYPVTIRFSHASELFVTLARRCCFFIANSISDSYYYRLNYRINYIYAPVVSKLHDPR